MSPDATADTVSVEIINHPARNLVIRRGRQASHYSEYCEEGGGGVWEVLERLSGALHEPIGMWLPSRLRKPDTSTYVLGIEVGADFHGQLPEGYEILDLPPCTMMVFHGPPFGKGESKRAIAWLREYIATYRPEQRGYAWADEEAPRFQLRRLGQRSYVEGRPVRLLSSLWAEMLS